MTLAQDTMPEVGQHADGDDRVRGGYVEIDGDGFYRIEHVEQLPPFLMSIVSDSDHWMFVASTGGLTTGRVSPDTCLFPYETDDRLLRSAGLTGPMTILRFTDARGERRLWRPMLELPDPDRLQRNLYKSLVGNRVIFEEVHHDHGMTFSYCWSNSDEYGFVRTATLRRHADAGPIAVQLIDGLVNLLPWGVEAGTQQGSSCLVDAYKRNELDAETGMGIYSMQSRISDQPAPAEALRANVVWCTGLDEYEVLLSEDQLPAFIAGRSLEAETLKTGSRGAYLTLTELSLAGDATQTWSIVADVAQDHVKLDALRKKLRAGSISHGELKRSIDAGTNALVRNIASADGLQHTGDLDATTHHFANVLFNNMRGGVFVENTLVERDDLIAFVETRNRLTLARHRAFFDGLPEKIAHPELCDRALKEDDTDLVRLCMEYLPLAFGRRHGDPSRPWNQFAIHVRDEHGDRIHNYQGNWRDIFQNWEALAVSYPTFLPAIIAKFVNASTPDGHNPYRITRDGIDWEVPEDGDAWGNIGYWGDHQIIYLLKLLEAAHDFLPGALDDLLFRDEFCYGDVPYRIKPYADVLKDPHFTIEFDTKHARTIDGRIEKTGTDGRLVHVDDAVYHVNLVEKLLVPILSKLSNLVIEGGIWMNTQRPEWNDANNALVGRGLSMVTLCYLRRHLAFCSEWLGGLEDRSVSLSNEVSVWFGRIADALDRHAGLATSDSITNAQRRALLDDLGGAFSDYRTSVYANGFTGKTARSLSEVRAMFDRATALLDHSIRANRCDNGLYHAYNLLKTEDGPEPTATVEHLYEMLEGQVAVLSAGVLSPGETAELLEALFASVLYRADQHSFLLYPFRKLPGFLAINRVSDSDVEQNPLLAALAEAGDRSLIVKSGERGYHFASSFTNARDVQARLSTLAQDKQYEKVVADHGGGVIELFERVFDHRAFTGRSGGMYKYEGLGCIYWHMVSKLLLAVQETHDRAQQAGDSDAAALAQLYDRVRRGLSFCKPVREYGAFPTDPYSHTPAHLGAQQPGMTGQVKEEVLTRFGELGVAVHEGQVAFEPTLLKRHELLEEPLKRRYVDVNDQWRPLELPADSLAFTLCQTPVVYQLGDEPGIKITLTDGSTENGESATRLSMEQSQNLFHRNGKIARIDVTLPASALRDA